MSLTNREKKQKREEQILFSLDKMGCLSRSQIQRLLNIPSVRNANKILFNMSRYLNHVRLHENVYYLNKKGREFVGSQTEINKTSQLEHRVMRNDLYIYYHYPKDWKVEYPAIWKENGKEYKLTSDAYFTYHGNLYFVEVDHKQAMVKNVKKIELYKSLFRLINGQRMGNPVLLFYTCSDIRKEKLLQECKKQQVECEVLTRTDIY